MIFQVYGNLSLIGAARSWGIVLTNIAVAVKKLGHDIRCMTTNGQANIDPRIRPYLVNGLDCNKPVFTYCSPPEIKKIDAANVYCMTAYESSILPNGWADMMNHKRLQIIVNSTQQSVMMEINGVKAVVVPLGIDPEIYRPNGDRMELAKDKYKFLSIGIPHYRKGFDILLKAFAEEFKPSEPVALVIKTDKLTKLNYWEIDIVKEIKKVQRNRTAEIILITGDCDNLAPLYRACNCYVSPSHGEGFGLTNYEAAACGLPVIMAESRVIKAPPAAQYHGYSPGAYMMEPVFSVLKECMRGAYCGNYKKFPATILTWEDVAKKVLALMGIKDEEVEFKEWVEGKNAAGL